LLQLGLLDIVEFNVSKFYEIENSWQAISSFLFNFMNKNTIKLMFKASPPPL